MVSVCVLFETAKSVCLQAVYVFVPVVCLPNVHLLVVGGFGLCWVCVCSSLVFADVYVR